MEPAIEPDGAAADACASKPAAPQQAPNSTTTGIPSSALLFESVYRELYRLAQAHMARQPIGHTLQPTALVNEAFLRLSPHLAKITTRAHFIRLAARAMRQILVDHGRRRSADKRLPPNKRVDFDIALDEALGSFDDRAGGLEELEIALNRLEALDPTLAELVELHFFGGQTIEAYASMQSISERQAYRRWRAARVFLRREMRPRDRRTEEDEE